MIKMMSFSMSCQEAISVINQMISEMTSVLEIVKTEDEAVKKSYKERIAALQCAQFALEEYDRDIL